MTATPILKISMTTLILASTSPYRAELLARLNQPFVQLAPNCDETPRDNESAAVLVERLAIDKAKSIAERHPDSVVIGSDQVADLDGTIIGKPGDRKSAAKQLQALSGKALVFYTGLALVQSSSSRIRSCVVPTRVIFRRLTDNKIERYLSADKPYGCAGSFKSESLGSSLVESMTSDDPVALIGLPLIRLSQFLEEFGIDIP